jgi:hypothetical protein
MTPLAEFLDFQFQGSYKSARYPFSKKKSTLYFCKIPKFEKIV